MVSFNYILAALAALTVPALCQSTPAQVVANLNSLTQKSQALQAPAQSITIVNGPLVIVGQGPFIDIIRGYVDIINTGTAHIQQMQGMAPVPAGASADAINTAYTGFVRAQTQVLNTLIGKAGLFQTVPFIGQPVAAVLRQFENIADTYSFSLVDNVASRATEIRNTADPFSMTIGTAIESYEGLALNKRDVSVAGKVAQVMVA